MTEQFQPISNTPPAGFAGKLKFYGRMLLDLQLLTIYKDLKKRLPLFTGKVLDVGCGQSPYKFLLNNKTRYFGIDVVESDNLLTLLPNLELLPNLLRPTATIRRLENLPRPKRQLCG